MKVSQQRQVFGFIYAILSLTLALWFVARFVPGTLGIVISILFALSIAAFLIMLANSCHKNWIQLENLHRNQQQILEAATEDRKALDDLADGLDVWILLVDSTATIIYANDAASSSLMVPNLVGQSILGATLSRELSDMVESAHKGLRVDPNELTIRQGKERSVIAKVWPANTLHDRIYISIYDMTDLRRLERARKDFVANVSHEFRTPMATIRAMTETILDDQPDLQATQIQYLNKIVNEVDRLTRISDDLLTLSVAESNTKAFEVLELLPIVQGAIHQLTPKAKLKGLELIGPESSSAQILGNAEQLFQVMLNLIDNAINYSSAGTICVSLVSDGEVARIQVQDSGIGIASDQIDRIFERFYRVDKARSRATGGTGLGLSIVRNIVEIHGGQIGVESVLNEGSTFWMNFPLVGQSAEELPPCPNDQ